MARLPRIDGIRRLYKTLAEAPPNLASLTIGTDGSMTATFREVAPKPVTPEAKPVPLIAGTPFPDDNTPIDVADLTLHPIPLEPGN